jgi:hypothetical protein
MAMVCISGNEGKDGGGLHQRFSVFAIVKG